MPFQTAGMEKMNKISTFQKVLADVEVPRMYLAFLVTQDVLPCINYVCMSCMMTLDLVISLRAGMDNIWQTAVLPPVLINSSVLTIIAFQLDTHVMEKLTAHWEMMKINVQIDRVLVCLDVKTQTDVYISMILEMGKLIAQRRMMNYFQIF